MRLLTLFASAALYVTVLNAQAPPCPPGFTCTVPVAPATVPVPAVSPMPAPIPATPSCTKPSSFYALGASLNKAATPNIAGLFIVAVPLTCDTTSFQVYSFTEHNVIPIGSGKNLTFKETTTTGFATPLKKVGPIDIYVFGQIGLSVNAVPATATQLSSLYGLASAYGVAGAFPPWKGSAWRGVVAAQKIDSKNVYSVLFGRSWK